MSYLDRLRLHFAGRFQATVTTVNNTVTYYNNKAFDAKYHLRQTAKLPAPGEEARGLWNPEGDNAWRLLGCRVTSAFYADGSAAPSDDPILQMVIADSDRRAPAKIVDLDPQQQLVSTVYGLVVRIADQRGDTLFSGELEPAPCDALWQRVQEEGVLGDRALAAMYQSVLRRCEWGDVSRSGFLQRLKAAAKDGVLAIKFNVDRYISDWDDKDFCTGRIVGTIGPATDGDPVHFTVGRQLVARFAPGSLAPENRLNKCVAIVDLAARKVRLDLGNALPVTRSGHAADIGGLSLAYAGPPDAAGRRPWMGLGTIDYMQDAWYEKTAGLVEVPADRELTDHEIEALKKSPLALLLQPSPGSQTAAVTEPPAGLHVGADRCVFRLAPGETTSTHLYATAYGEPLPGARILNFFDSAWLRNLPGHPTAGVPASGVEFPARVVADERGRATLPLTWGNPRNPRDYIDGQVYGIRYAIEATISPFAPYPFAPSDYISVLVFDEFEPDEPIAWFGSEKGSIQPMFQQYANLYPVMHRFIDMGSYEDVCRYRDKLIIAFSLDELDPNAMPVSRDLSPAKRSAILRWLRDVGPDGKPLLGVKPAEGEAARGGPEVAATGSAATEPAGIHMDPQVMSGLRVGGKEAVCRALQTAIELEHATIPPYLYALYSLKPGPRGTPGPNSAIAAIIQAILKEEMLHMALACNVMNALGGQPAIFRRGFVPKYPGPLPGSVAAGLNVGLEPFSIDLVNRVFLVIEKPEDEPLGLPNAKAGQGGELKTIGQFYRELKNQIRELGDEAFVGAPERQVTKAFNGLKPVTDVATACEVIDTIILQGEGTSSSLLDIDPAISHYHRFAEIGRGKKRVTSDAPEASADERYQAGGEPIPFEPSGVFEVPTNPTLELYPLASPERRMVDNFNYTYTSLLKTLHAMFNGQPELYTQALGVMMSMRQQATDMMAGTNIARPIGPTFDYLPVNPSRG